MASHRHIQSVLAILAVCAAALGNHGTKRAVPPAPKPLPPLSAQEIFKRVSPSVMVVESLDAEGKVTVFGSGVVIAPGRVTTNRHVIEDGVSGPRQGFFLPWVLDSTGGKPTTNETLSWLPPG